MEINSKKIEELVSKSSNVIIVSHKHLDLDALGSCLGMHYICSGLNKNAYILVNDESHEDGVKRAFNKLEELKYKLNINNFNQVKKILNKDSLLVILDTNREQLLQSPDILKIKTKKILLDHHICGEDSIKKLDYEYINTEESSTAEIIIEIIDDLGIYIPSYAATVMLAGIFIDTNRFYLKTTKRTFKAGALLTKFGADMNELQYLLKQDFYEYTQRQKIVISTSFINKEMALAVGEDDKIYEKQNIAKAALTILQFKDIEASFVIAKTKENEISISARSLGEINVQQIMNRMGGGGHSTDAAAQLKGSTISEARELLLESIFGKK